MTLDGKTVIVIGGASGIGLATAVAARRAGASVVVAGRNKDGLERAKATVGPGTEAAVLDVTDEAAHAAFFGRIGAFDHLVLTAAQVVTGPFRDTDTAAARAAVDSRLWGSYFAARHGSPHLRPGGSITLFSGAAAWKPVAGMPMAAVAASCGAVEALTLALAVELAPVRVNAVRPGATDTPLLAAGAGPDKEATLKRMADALPVRRVGRPEDVADAVLFLLTNPNVTGTVLNIDGGLRLT